MKPLFSLKINHECELKLLEDSHSAELFNLADQNRNYLKQWLAWLDATKTSNDTAQFIQFELNKFNKREGLAAGIWYREKLVGVISFNQINWANKKATLGYWCSAEYQGLGLVTNACRALINYGFKELKLNRIEIACATENKKSQAIPRRLGLKLEGIARDAEWLYDRFVDHIIFSVLAKEWNRLD